MARPGWSGGISWQVVMAALTAALSGCAAVTNPVGKGVPVRMVPEELLSTSHKQDVSLPLTLLGQPTPDAYRLAHGDILAVYIEGWLPREGQQQQQPTIPYTTPTLLGARDQRRLPPTIGYPIPVQPDGTVDLPGVGPVRVHGMTIAEAREAIRRAYVERKLLKEDAVLLVSLMQPRQYQVLVLRQEATSFISGPNGITFGSKRGLGFEIELFAYENDVLHALARTGGLPGVDTCNEIIVQKNAFRNEQERALLMQSLSRCPGHANPLEALRLPGPILRIPLRCSPGHPPAIRPEDVLLESGDVVYIPACNSNVFYTGGLLPPGEWQIPPDRDLDVVEAIGYVKGAMVNGAFGGSNLSGQLLQPGIGNPSPSQVTVVRRTPAGTTLPIIVDLNVALRDARERIRIHPGDILILQERPTEAMTRYFTQTFLNFNILWEVVRTSRASGILDISAPDRLDGRLGTVNFLRPDQGGVFP